MSRPSRDQTLMRVALIISLRSTCDRLHVGAVMAREGRILTTGYNGPPSGMPHCEHQLNLVTPIEPCKNAVHAEANAVVWAARYGMSTDGCELFITHSPCIACAQLIVNAGIVRVVYDKEYRSFDGLDFLEKAKVETYHAGP